jgi:hypothetical protein
MPASEAVSLSTEVDGKQEAPSVVKMIGSAASTKGKAGWPAHT